MFQAIKNFIGSSDTKPVAGDDVKLLAEAMFTSISREVLPLLKEVSKNKEYFRSDKSAILGTTAVWLDIRDKSPEGFIKELNSFFKDVLGEQQTILKLIDDSVNDKVFLTLSNARELAIIKTISDLSTITLFTIDVLDYVVTGNDTAFPAKRLTKVAEGLPKYRMLLKPYMDDFGKHVKNLGNVAVTTIDTKASASMMDKLLAKHGKLVMLPAMNGFISNPIYHIRMYLVDREVEKYEALREKKKLLELKLLDLKMQAAGKHDEKLAKQIAYYEDKISGIEYDLSE